MSIRKVGFLIENGHGDSNYSGAQAERRRGAVPVRCCLVVGLTGRFSHLLNTGRSGG
jgi:hypothetical protein